MAVLIREPPRSRRPDAACVAAGEPRRARRLRDRAQVRRRRAPAGGRVLERGVDRGDHRFRAPRVRRGAARRDVSRKIPRALEPAGIVLLDKPAGISSFAAIAELRRRTGARTGHAGTLDPFATGLLVVLSGSATRLAQSFVKLDKRYVTEVDLTATTSTGDPEGEVVETHEAPTPRGARRAARGSAGRDRAADPGSVRGEDRRGARLPAAPQGRGGRDAAPALARRRPRRRRLLRGDTVTLDLRVGSGTYVRAIAAALGGHCRTLRRTEVGPFSVEEAGPRVIPSDEALARLA